MRPLADQLPALALAATARFQIPAQSMPAALKAFAEQAHMQVLYDYDAVASVRCNPVEGEFEKQEALTRLLLNTGLEARYASEQAYVDRLLGEPVYGVADVHVHPLEPIGFRLTISKVF